MEITVHKKDRSYIYQINLDKRNSNDSRIIAYNYIVPYANVLDVGCACGDFGVLLSQEKQCTLFGMEYDIKSIEEANKKKVFKELHQIDLNTFKSIDYQEYQECFDFITLLDVLEHTLYPNESLLRLKPYLKKNGFFIISLPNISFGDIKLSLLRDDFTYTDTGILDRTHLKFFTHKTIAIFCAELGLEIVACQVTVEDISMASKDVPYYIKKFIKKNPHSYAYQYIMKLKISNIDSQILQTINQNAMRLEWSSIQQELNRIKKFNWINTLLPVGSKRRTFVKKLYHTYQDYRLRIIP
ncbi:MAG: class I SAM-dependent methyltransferase [Sulfuricurvum sp.]|nr:class I SAM-dependent methyltransferase [Sulfuricurvum sp.]